MEREKKEREKKEREQKQIQKEPVNNHNEIKEEKEVDSLDEARRSLLRDLCKSKGDGNSISSSLMNSGW